MQHCEQEYIMNQIPSVFWSIPESEILQNLESTKDGLTADEARDRLIRYGANLLKPPRRSDALTLLLSQFKSPIILILFFAIAISFFLHDTADALIILLIVLVSGLLGFWQEYGASNAIQKLLSIVQIKSAVLRSGKSEEIPVENIVPGDIVILNAGDIIPGDGLILESKDLFVDESMLTGETFPAEKTESVLPAETQLAHRTNTVWMGTHVVSGSTRAIIVCTGKETEFGKVSERLKLRPLETEFERGIRSFGYFLLEVTMLLVVAIFAINVYLARPVLESIVF
jgi:Mg2+-importing ATPase